MNTHLSDADFIAAMQQGLPSPGEVLELGNADLVGTGTWTGSPPPRESVPDLPVYPKPDDLPERPTHQREPESFAARLERDAKRNALVDVAFCGAFMAVGAAGSLLLQGVVL